MKAAKHSRSRRRPVIGLGAGGHAKVLIETLRLSSRFHVAGLLDSRKALHGSKVLGVPVLGDDSLLAKTKAGHFFVAIGSTGDAAVRQRLYDSAVALGLQPVQVLHPSATISPSAEPGPGAQVLAGAILNAGAKLGANVIINTGAIVEHDCVVGDHAHVATGAKLCGAVLVGNGAHIGAGAVVRQCISVGKRAVVGAGSVVVKKVAEGSVVAGVPARLLSSPEAKHDV